MRDETFDVVIVGYGPVGQMAAILLGQKGYRVSVFERWPQIYGLPRAAVYDDETARIFQAAGVTDEVLKVTEPIPDFDFYEWRNQAGETLLRLERTGPGRSGWPVANFFAQPQLQAVLDTRAKSLPTVEVNQGSEPFAHLADRRTEAAGAAIRDGVIKPEVAGLQDHVQHFLFGDGVADLHRAAGDLLRLAG